MRFHYFVVALLFFSIESFAVEEFQEKTFQMQSALTDIAAAKKEMIDNATMQLTMEQAKILMGNTESKRAAALIKKRVARFLPKFVPVVRSGEVRKKGNLFD